jgi:hypothetical protein
MGFFTWLGDLFAGSQRGSESEKKRLMDSILRDIKHNQYRRYYKPLSGELDPAVGEFFYEVYKTVYQAGLLMKNAAQSENIKQIIIEENMDKPLATLKAQLSHAKLVERTESHSIKELSVAVEQDLEAFNDAFDSKLIHRIDRYYNIMMVFAHFVSFDFFPLVKKFDIDLPEHNFEYTPHFKRVRAELVVEQIKEFLEALHPIEQDYDWNTVIQLARQYRNNIEVIKLNQWNSLLSHIRHVQNTGILSLIVRYADKNPIWQPQSRLPDHHIAESYRNLLRNQVSDSLGRILKQKQNERMIALAVDIFGKEDIPPRLQSYTETEHEALTRSGVIGLIYLHPLNYVAGFMQDFYKTTAYELCNLFLIKGHWSSPELSRRFSDSFQETLLALEELQEFDTKEAGSKIAHIKALLGVNKRRPAEAGLAALNNSAYDLIEKFIKALNFVEGQFRALYNDLTTKTYEIIVDFEKIESDQPLDQRLELVSFKLADMTQMLRLSIGTAEE